MTELQMLARILVVCFTVAFIFCMGAAAVKLADDKAFVPLTAALVVAGIVAPAVVALGVLVRILSICL